MGGRLEGRVLEAVGGTYRVHTAEGALECSLRGRIKRDGPGRERVAVGDRVEVERLEDGSCRIARLLPRRSVLSRHAATGRGERPIAANVDQVAAVFSWRRPEPDRHVLDRLLVLAERDGIPAFIVANKSDLRDSGEPDPFADYRAAGYQVVVTSVPLREGLQTLRERLAERVTVFTGPSGSGKSSLLNVLAPGSGRRVGEVGDRSGRGRHTTVSARLIPLGDDTWLADTPGIQFVGLGPMDPPELEAAFPEIRALADGCRFADCRHRAEPGCEVRTAVADGRLSSARHEGYLRLLGEVEEAAEKARRGG